MKKLVQFNPFVFALVMLLSFSFSNVIKANMQNTLTPIEDILGDPVKFADKSVTIKGFVIQYAPAIEQKTAYYYVKGETGGTIQVNTSLIKPKIQREYKINGIVKIEASTQVPILIEIKKAAVIPIWLYTIIGVILLLVILLVIVLITNSSGKSQAPAQAKAAEQKEVQYDNSYKTVQIVTNQSDKKTLVFIPGKLVIKNGEDKGKEIILAGYQDTDGAVVTLGSREETGDRKSAHIRLMEPTVSRSQAEIILLNKDKKVVVKNLSKTNYTHVNGEELLPNTLKEIKYGDLIKTGEVEFQYTN
jgi:cellobiose-specific phosphotransferase system component IIB